jgi:hypothetical protein
MASSARRISSMSDPWTSLRQMPCKEGAGEPFLLVSADTGTWGAPKVGGRGREKEAPAGMLSGGGIRNEAVRGAALSAAQLRCRFW